MKLFKDAKPVWIDGEQETKNLRAIFQTTVLAEPNMSVAIATSCIYKLYINGKFIAYGPARAGRNHFRVDEISLCSNDECEEFILTFEVQSYQVNSFFQIKQPPFIQAEICAGSRVVSFTGDDNFIAGVDSTLVQKTQRFSYQRPMVEGYILSENSHLYRTMPSDKFNRVITVVPEKTIIERRALYPEYRIKYATPICSGVSEKKKNVCYEDSRSYLNISPCLQGFKKEELTWHISRELQEYKNISERYNNSDLCDLSYNIFSFNVVETGFLNVDIEILDDSVVYFVFDEVLINADVNIIRDECCRAVKYQLAPGKYSLSLFEPYSMKYVKVFVASGKCRVGNVSLTEYCHPAVDWSMADADDDINCIVSAAINSFRANAVDIFMDCPTRERAGWLCDSFFTARAEYILTESNLVERDFLENFLHEDTYDFATAERERGMVPMCYPADQLTMEYIPNWGLWFILELLDFLRRTGDRTFVNRFREKVAGILSFHFRLENEEHLLCNIPGGVFVEWSHANEMTQDINFPSNMLYSAALRATAELFGDVSLIERADSVVNAVKKYSFIDGFFCDRAVIKENKIETVHESSEACQYYAFLCNIATPEEYPELFDVVVKRLGYKRRRTGEYPEMCFAEPFIGIPLRIEMLLKYSLFSEAENEIRSVYLKQAQETGSLWETLGMSGSYNHGFASAIVYWLECIKRKRNSGIY